MRSQSGSAPRANSYSKAKRKSNASIVRGTSKKAQSSAARKGAEGPKKSQSVTRKMFTAKPKPYKKIK